MSFAGKSPTISGPFLEGGQCLIEYRRGPARFDLKAGYGFFVSKLEGHVKIFATGHALEK